MGAQPVHSPRDGPHVRHQSATSKDRERWEMFIPEKRWVGFALPRISEGQGQPREGGFSGKSEGNFNFSPDIAGRLVGVRGPHGWTTQSPS